MKIGAFAKKNQVSIDTLRHYMSLGLLLPSKAKSQYAFDSRCQEAFNEVTHLKSLGFSLQEIKDIFVVNQLGKITSIQKEACYKDVFKIKRDSVRAEIGKLEQKVALLEEELQRLDALKDTKKFSLGLELQWLGHLCCHHCGGPLILKEALIDDNRVISGRLKCSCGTGYRVVDGIVCQEELNTEGYPPIDVQSYIKHTDEDYLLKVYKTLEWFFRNIPFEGLSKKLILELGSGSGFFLRRIYDSLPEDALYIAVDSNYEKLKALKETMEKADSKKALIFICTDFLCIPLKAASVDVVCDFTGTSNYSFDNKGFLLSLIQRYYKKDAELYGAYIVFKNFSHESQIPPDFRPNFRKDCLEERIEQLGFVKHVEYLSNTVSKGGIYESYFKDDEKVAAYCFIGKRSG